MTKATQRKTVEVARKRVPLKKLLHGREIRTAAKALEDFRMSLNEAEFLYGAKITLTMDTYGECMAIAKRLETDKEFEDRMERARLAAEAKRQRDVKRKQLEATAARDLELKKRAKAIEIINSIANEVGIAVVIEG